MGDPFEGLFDSGDVLERVGVNLTTQARRGDLEPVRCRDAEIARVVDILLRQSKNNPALIGKAGVGKTAIVEGLAQRVAVGDVPPALKDVRVFALDHVALLAGTSFRGQYEERIRKLVRELSADPDLILFVDELHNLIGQGTALGAAMDAANMPKPALVRGDSRVSGATTGREYAKWTRGHPALELRFQPVLVEELDAIQTWEVLVARRPRLERHHAVAITDDALKAAIVLTDRFVPERARPDKAIDVLDEACAHAQATARVSPELDRLIRERRKVDAMIRRGLTHEAAAPTPPEDLLVEVFPILERIGEEIEKMLGGPRRAETDRGGQGEHALVVRRSRTQVRDYVIHKFDNDLPPAELAGAQAAYRLFGLIPDTLDLRRTMVDLLTEQIAGYYDPDSNALYLPADIDPVQVRLIISHELVHALQDQYLDLDSLIQLKRQNDRRTAAQSVLEGQATLSQILVLMPEQKLESLPDFWQLRRSLGQQQEQMKIFAQAPLWLRESLLFPYLGGAEFVRWFEREHPGEQPYGKRMPASTEQILHPSRYAKGDAPIELAFAGPPSDTVRYEDDLGEFETRLLFTQFLGDETEAGLLASGWGGDRYRVLGRAADVLVWYTVWDDRIAADRFAKGLERAWHKRTAPRGLPDGRPKGLPDGRRRSE